MREFYKDYSHVEESAIKKYKSPNYSVNPMWIGDELFVFVDGLSDIEVKQDFVDGEYPSFDMNMKLTKTEIDALIGMYFEQHKVDFEYVDGFRDWVWDRIRARLIMKWKDKYELAQANKNISKENYAKRLVDTVFKNK